MVKETKPKPSPQSSQGLKVDFSLDQLKVGHNNAEMYLQLGEAVLMMTPTAFKKMMIDLEQVVHDYEQKHGTIEMPSGSSSAISPVKSMLKNLYQSRKIAPRLMSVNTKRRKHIVKD